MTDLDRAIQRINFTIVANCPMVSSQVGAFGDSSAISFVPDPSATPGQIQAAQNAIDTFDWSAAAQATWEAQQAQANAGTEVSQTTDINILTRSIAIMLGLRLNELIAFYNADLAARGATTFTPGPIGQCPQVPMTEAIAKSDIKKVIQSGAVNT